MEWKSGQKVSTYKYPQVNRIVENEASKKKLLPLREEELFSEAPETVETFLTEA